jgi:RNA polymerase sigma factor (sigma-70 family)
MPHGAGADEAAIARLERDAVVRALKTLPKRQRGAVVLRFYADASERQAAAAMGVSVGAVKGYTSRGLAALHEKLDDLS